MKMKELVRENFIRVAIGVVFVLILVSAGLSFYNRHVMNRALLVQEQSDMVLRETERVYENIRLMDISSRGYALVRDPLYLFWSVEMAEDRNREIFRNLDSLFEIQGYSNPKNYASVKQGLDYYINEVYAKMVQHLQHDRLDGYLLILKKDFGADFWYTFKPFLDEVTAYEDGLNQQAQEQYEAAVRRNSLVQILLILLGLPTLGLVMYTLRKEEKDRKQLLLNLQENNRKYIFNDGNHEAKNAHEILENSIRNFQKASRFVNRISEGDYEADWEQLNEDNASLNRHNLAGRLIFMRDEMKKVKEEGRKRLWATDGLSQFSDIIRNHQNALDELCDNALKFLVKYMNAQQGSLYILREEENEEPHLCLAACYAFDRKKYLEKRIGIGQGILGQSYLEAETVLMTELPQGYTSITSGLGDATPGCLLIVPLKNNEQVQALIELASFQEFQPYQISFLEKAGESIASAITNVQNTEETNHLLAQLQTQAEELKAQEEELRQNMEELEATQEEMRRKEVVLEQQLSKKLKGK